jgi:hypothetical protein
MSALAAIYSDSSSEYAPFSDEQKPLKAKRKLYKPVVSSKRLIRQACVQIIEDPTAKPNQKLQAATLLEKLLRYKTLAPGRRKKLRNYGTNTGNSVKNSPINDILERANNS